jgi:hypothetical protein
LLLIGFGGCAQELPWGILGLGVVLGLGVLLILYDRYTANIKILFDDYLGKQEKSWAPDFDLLY